MEQITANAAAEEGGGSILSKFGELPSGVQRLIIAVMIVLVLIVIVFIQRLIRTEEAVSEEMDMMETVEAFSTKG